MPKSIEVGGKASGQKQDISLDIRHQPPTMVDTMKLFWMTLPALMVLTACSGKDSDTGADADADGGASLDDTGTEPAPSVVDAPGCSTAGIACIAYGPGVLWAAQDVEASCATSNENAVAGGQPEMVFLADGCPDDPYAQCSDMAATDEDGNPVTGLEYTTYFYGGISTDNAMSHCTDYGGTYQAW